MSDNISEKSDEELALQFKNGDTMAFDILVGRYKDPLVEFVTRFLGDYHSAEDIVQESFLRVYKSIERYRPLAKFSTWLYKIAINLSNSYLKKNPKKRFLNIEDSSILSKMSNDTKSPSDALEDKELSRLISSVIGRLSKRHRTVFIMRDIQGMKYDDISSSLGCSIGTVKSRLNRARFKLKKVLRPYLKRYGRD